MATSDKEPKRIRYIDTRSAYDQWAQVYDTDGNFLQALDTIEMQVLLPKAVSLMESPKPWKIVDLGCGTGRNTIQLLDIPEAEIIGLDLSDQMLDIARTRLEEKASSLGHTVKYQLAVCDLLGSDSVPKACAGNETDLVISTLVIEHIPLPVYFKAVSLMLKEGGLLLLTNMHSEQGKISQAGFVDPATGDKVRPTSYPHTVEEVVQEAAKHGLEVIEPFKETSVDENNCAQLGPRARKWLGIKVWYGGIFRMAK